MVVMRQVNCSPSNPRLNQREWITYSFLAAVGVLAVLLLVVLV